MPLWTIISPGGVHMQYRFLGKDRLKVSAIGYGCPPFQGKLSDADERQAIAVLDVWPDGSEISPLAPGRIA